MKAPTAAVRRTTIGIGMDADVGQLTSGGDDRSASPPGIWFFGYE
jgi:hypothetical protein